MVNGGSVTSGAASAFPQNGAVIADPPVVNGGGSSSTATDVAAAYPRGGLDLPNIAFGARTTLAYAEKGANTGGTLTVKDGRHAASIALLGNYMAASFVTAADGRRHADLGGGTSGKPAVAIGGGAQRMTSIFGDCIPEMRTRFKNLRWRALANGPDSRSAISHRPWRRRASSLMPA